MKTSRKIVWIGTIIIGFVSLIYIGFPRILSLYLKYKWKYDLKNASSIGIIGGADGPTSIILTTSSSSFLVTIILVLLFLSGAIYLIRTRKKR